VNLEKVRGRVNLKKAGPSFHLTGLHWPGGPKELLRIGLGLAIRSEKKRNEGTKSAVAWHGHQGKLWIGEKGVASLL